MATLTVPSPQMVPASFGASRKFRPLSTHGMPKEPRTMSPERPHRFSTLGYPGQSFPSTPLSPRSPGPMSPPLSAKSFGTFIDSEPSTPAYSPRMDYDWDSSTLVLLRPMSSSSEPSSPSEPVWDMMTPMKLPSKASRTTRPKGPSIRTKEISSETSLSSHPVATTKTTRPPDIRVAPVRTQTVALVSQKREIEEEEKSRLQEEPDRNIGAAPLGKLASKMKLMLRRKNTIGKKKRTKEKDYYEVDHVDDPAILQSAFPKKTFIFLVILSGLAYYYIDDEEPDWTDYVYNACSAEMPSAVPLHFFANKEEVDQWKADQEVDPSSPLRDPRLMQLVSENLDGRARGWMMSEEDSKQDNLPVTHGMRLAANSPGEDFFALGTNPGAGSQPWNYWAVMDGHAGRDTALHLQFTLIPEVSSFLCGLPIPSSSAEIEASIKQSFLRVDRKLMDYARRAANWSPAANIAGLAALNPALSGSCALLAMFDSEKSKLRVACTGDSRAVLGRWDPATQKYTMIPLSVDQTGFNPKEVERLAAEHPGEPDIIDPSSGRLLGIAVTRAFGDHRWKWDNEIIKAAQYKFFGSSPRPGNKTPPYMTAEPEVTETDIVSVDVTDPRASGKSDFMIMASDGLWDRISSEHAVECVQRWLEARARGNGSPAASIPGSQSIRPKGSTWSGKRHPSSSPSRTRMRQCVWRETCLGAQDGIFSWGF
ncbi:protein serine/threonine phosphatase 2C [Pyrenochaeta sp. DS3sAY3a]|nr:protein serine/threonine phosphatase 2C [Pyrenochaeta sp. DS3sAY3a]